MAPPISNTSRFRVPPLEDVPQDEDSYAAFSSLYRVVAEFGFVSTIFAGVCIQRNGIIHQTSTAADVTKLVVLFAGAIAFGVNVECLYDGSIFAPKYNYLNPLPRPRRRWRRRRAQREASL